MYSFFLYSVANRTEIKKRFTELPVLIYYIFFEFLTFVVKYDFRCALI